MGYEIVLTSDRTMMSNHHGKEFLGFIATGPPIAMPESLWMMLAAPKVKVDDAGRPREAPYGMRKIEAVLMDAGFNAAIIDPDHIDKHLDSMKILMLSHHDYFAYGPPSSEWWSITGMEPINRRSFIRFMNSPVVRKAKEKGVKIIVGGPAAWQWLYELELMDKWGVDTIVDGEGEKVVVELVEKALRNEPLPRYVYVGAGDVPGVNEIPVIKGASVNGLVEIMRGCPRGCRFCSVTLRPLRFIPLEKILAEIDVNIRSGLKGAILHSEDVLLYHADGVKPRPDPILRLHREVLERIGEKRSLAWSHASLAAVKYAEENHKLISKLMNELVLNEHRRFLGVEVGIETGSVKLAHEIMRAKSSPYPVEEWPNVVEDAFRIMHENKIIPAATVILGIPGETPDDVMKTIELIERLKPYRSIIVPMFFVPMGALKHNAWFLRDHLKHEHIDALLAMYNHTIYWAEDIMNKFYFSEPYHAPLKLLLKYFMGYVRKQVNRYAGRLEEIIKK
ncbi:Fe-S oxidoreductase [Desulfurococcus amylolyticus 1221n]|uniref:Fe-S oxidoreductase n=1 Tax=Desulfurococcus amylolyticus (strain DSM 18924 / JCM 16383 / VKM B-2413 / 1221n) TaxID=490899 RepID=B8D443_DESA1|nr:radical SAM protein [Desulfurococcus amylolyticus]ACL10874.1 Fe-S oxidoreductase [Desulfurococcus amylolyticus 1221n]